MEFTRNIQFNANPAVGQDLTITYNGFLGNSQELSIVYGYGDSWENTTETKMDKIENGFVSTINLLNYDTFNFCFKNSNNEWDNNSYCNYITPITPAVENVQSFDIDSLIEELLEPIVNIEPVQEVDVFAETEENLDLGYQLSNLISEADETPVELVEYSTLDEVLTATKIDDLDELIANELFENTPDTDLENDNVQNIVSEVSDNVTSNIEQISVESNSEEINEIVKNNNEENVFEDFIKNLSAITSNVQSAEQNITVEPDIVENTLENIIEEQKNDETALVKTSESFVVSSRQLGKFYLFKKRIKLALYKAFVKLPKLLLGLEEKE